MLIHAIPCHPRWDHRRQTPAVDPPQPHAAHLRSALIDHEGILITTVPFHLPSRTGPPRMSGVRGSVREGVGARAVSSSASRAVRSSWPPAERLEIECLACSKTRSRLSAGSRALWRRRGKPGLSGRRNSGGRGIARPRVTLRQALEERHRPSKSRPLRTSYDSGSGRPVSKFPSAWRSESAGHWVQRRGRRAPCGRIDTLRLPDHRRRANCRASASPATRARRMTETRLLARWRRPARPGRQRRYRIWGTRSGRRRTQPRPPRLPLPTDRRPSAMRSAGSYVTCRQQSEPHCRSCHPSAKTDRAHLARGFSPRDRWAPSSAISNPASRSRHSRRLPPSRIQMRTRSTPAQATEPNSRSGDQDLGPAFISPEVSAAVHRDASFAPAAGRTSDWRHRDAFMTEQGSHVRRPVLAQRPATRAKLVSRRRGRDTRAEAKAVLTSPRCIQVAAESNARADCRFALGEQRGYRTWAGLSPSFQGRSVRRDVIGLCYAFYGCGTLTELLIHPGAPAVATTGTRLGSAELHGDARDPG